MLIDGRTIANDILEDLTKRVHELEESYNIQPHLAVIRVGDDPATTSYIEQKDKTAKKIGAVVSVYNFPSNVNADDLKTAIDFLQSKTDIHGTILQLPLSPHLDSEKLLLEIHPDKDVDGFRPQSPFVVPIAQAVIKALEIPYSKTVAETKQTFDEWLQSQKIVVMGKGKTGGQPVIALLRKRGTHVTIIDSQTQNPETITKQADILICAVGKEEVITREMLKKDVVLLGIGMHINKDGSFAGDYDEKEIKDTASWYTPIPGGMGPINVACLMENLVQAAENTVKN